jgi:hypothetical protein
MAQLKQGKKFRRQVKNYWKVEIKGFLKSAGELGLRCPRLPRLSEVAGLRWLASWQHEPSAIPFRVRLGYAVAILRAPGLARKGKLVEYIKSKWPGKADGLHEQGWVRYEKVAGFVRFKCRTRRDKPGEVIEILLQDTYWPEKKALGILGKGKVAEEVKKLYHFSRVEGTELREAQQDYQALLAEAEAKEAADTKAKLKNEVDNFPIPTAKEGVPA